MQVDRKSGATVASTSKSKSKSKVVPVKKNSTSGTSIHSCVVPKGTRKSSATLKSATKPAVKGKSNLKADAIKSKLKPDPNPSPAPEQDPVPYPSPAPVPEPIAGTVVVKYNHYDDSFPIVDGVLRFDDVDEKYCFSFAFPGKYQLHLFDNAVHPSNRTAENRLPEDQVAKIFPNLVDGATYFVEVEEDIEESKKAREAYSKAPPKIMSMAEVNAMTYASSKTEITQPNAQSQLITAELKGMKASELSGERYQQLLEARALEDCLFSN